MTHYRAFIEVAKGLRTTQEDLQHADGQLDALLADLPKLSAACEHFAKSTAAFTASRAESKQLLSAFILSCAATFSYYFVPAQAMACMGQALALLER